MAYLVQDAKLTTVDARTDEIVNGFPWLTASKLPELIRFAPQRRGPAIAGTLPTHVRTPEREELAVFGQELATEVGRRHGSPVEMVHLNRGIFDEASISVITRRGRLAVGQPIFFEPSAAQRGHR